MVRANVTIEHRDRVAVVTIDRPQRRNALDHTTILELAAAQDEICALGIDRVRAVVLTGSPPAFSAGADLTGVEAGQFSVDLLAMLRGFGALDVAVIAAIDGPALGAGAQLAIAADLRVATPDSRIGVPAARLGLVVDQWTVARLVSEFTAPVARSMLLTAEVYSAGRLHSLGGVHRLGDLDAALAWAADIAELAPLTIAGHKVALEAMSAYSDLHDSVVDEARRVAWASADAAEGQAAFLEKRPATFMGR